MPDSEPAKSSRSALTRRRLLSEAGAVGVAGAATVWLGNLGKGPFSGIATAAEVESEALRRSSYMELSSPSFTALVDGTGHQLELIGVEDLPVAASVPALRESEDAFSLRFRGDGANAFEQGTHELRHERLGDFSLFLAPIERRTGTQDYEAVIDRTIVLPGSGGDGAPRPVDPGERGSESPRREVGPARAAPRLRHAKLRRAPSGRRLLAEITLGGGAVELVRATLMRRGHPVGTASARPNRGRARLGFATRVPPRGAAYVLQLTVVDAEGKATRLHRRLRID